MLHLFVLLLVYVASLCVAPCICCISFVLLFLTIFNIMLCKLECYSVQKQFGCVLNNCVLDVLD